MTDDDPSGLADVKADQLALWSCDDEAVSESTAWTRLKPAWKLDRAGLTDGSIVGVSRIGDDGKAPKPALILPADADMDEDA